MTRIASAVFVVVVLCLAAPAQTPRVGPVPKITPGKVIVPTEKMRRPWGELVSLDLKTRTGTFRQESDDAVMSFTVLPYAELLHDGAFGDLQDFRVGERVIFRLHENDKGDWTWLTYIQDELNFLVNHKEFYIVDRIDPEKGRLTVAQGHAGRSWVRTKDIVLDTDADTRFWKQGQPARFADIKLGDPLRTKTHGIGKGQTRVCWDVFLDEESVAKFQKDQRAVHARRMKTEGLPGYIDRVDGNHLELTLFQEAREEGAGLKVGQKVHVALAGVDRTPSGPRCAGVLSAVAQAGNLRKLALTLETAEDFQETGLARLWNRDAGEK